MSSQAGANGEHDKATPELDGFRMPKREQLRTLGRCARYLAVRSFVIALTVLLGIYGAIWLTNFGGISDASRIAAIEYGVRFSLNSGAGAVSLWKLTPEEKEALLQHHVALAIERSGLDKPFIIRSFGYFRDALTLSLGHSANFNDRQGSHKAIDVLLDRLPATLLLFGTANLLSIVGSLLIALSLARGYGGLRDRVVTLLIPLFSGPPWFHGIFLIMVFSVLAKLLPFGGIMSPPIPETTFGYVLGVIKHMILPVSACVLGTMPYAVYANRALFLIHSRDDYVELGLAKGLSRRRLQWNYILRPNLPPVITNFATVVLIAWQGVILTEGIFAWPGLGHLLARAIRLHEVQLVIGTVTIFAIVLGASLFLLDILYVLVDPRVKLGARRTA